MSDRSKPTSGAGQPLVLAVTARSDIGGGPEHLFRLMESLGGRAEFIVACPRQQPYWDRYGRLSNVQELVEIPARRLTLAAIRNVVRTAVREDVDVVHSHGKGAGIYGRISAVLARRRCVHTFHGLHVGSYSKLARHAYLMLERALSVVTHIAICVSPGERDQIREARLMPERKLEVIPNGVRAQPRSVRVSSSADLHLVAVTRYNFQKNTELAVEILRELNRRRAGSARLSLLGTGDGLAGIRRSVLQFGLESSVHLVGAVDDTAPFMSDADVFLSTSRWEGLPLAVLEAMASGLPVVATDVVGNRDTVVHGQSGLLFAHGDVRSGADAVEMLRASGMRRRLGDAARQRVHDYFSVEAMADATFLVYQATRSL